MMPVISPAAGGAPDAIAMPMQSGSATRKTTTEARRSWENGFEVADEFEVVEVCDMKSSIQCQRAGS